MNMKAAELSQLFEQFKQLRILVIGDVMLDAYQWGKVERISPEAPVPVVDVMREEARPGGAANVCLNLVHLGVQTHILSVIGHDEAGEKLKHQMRISGIRCDGLFQSDRRPTTVKTRIMSGSQQLLRIDKEIQTDLTAAEYAPLMDWFKQKASQFDAVILQDYDKGVLAPGFIEALLNHCREKGIPTAVDPKKRHFNAFVGADLFKPNLKELKEGLKININPEITADVSAAATQLREQLACRKVLITLSEYGIFYQQENESGNHPAHFRRIADVSGAGDTVISVAAACLAAKTSLSLLAALSNLAGGLVCEELGVVPINSANLLQEAITHIAEPA